MNLRQFFGLDVGILGDANMLPVLARMMMVGDNRREQAVVNLETSR